MIKLDKSDKIIINELMKNARTSASVIAKKIGVSTTAVHQRIRKLEKQGVLADSKYVINSSLIGYKTSAFVGVYLEKSSNYNTTSEELSKIPEVLETYYTTGDYSIIIKIQCIDNEHLMKVLNEKIQKIESISRTETFIILDNPINRQITL